MNVSDELLKAGLKSISAKTLSLRGKKIWRRYSETTLKKLEDFKYNALTQKEAIRLLHILPGTELEPIGCHVTEVSLNDAPAYETLSYTWKVEGDEEGDHEIRCNDHRFKVGANLYHAIAEFRRMERLLPIWVDQICINQSDAVEKDEQMRKMGRIYQQAERVVVWLGKSSAVIEFGLKFMESLPPYQSASFRDNRKSDSIHMSQGGDLPSENPDDPINSVLIRSKSGFASLASDHPKWYAALLILRRGWFSRTWTLQEMFLGRQVAMYIGGFEIAPKVLVNAAKWLLDFYATDFWDPVAGLKSGVLQDYPHLLSFSEFFAGREEFRNEQKWSLEKYFQVVSTRGVTEPRDKVYAGRSIVQAGDQFIVDNKRSTAEVYINFAAALFQSESGVFGLSLVGDREAFKNRELVKDRKKKGKDKKKRLTQPTLTLCELPSWVPDLAVPTLPKPLKYVGGDGFHASSASATHQRCFVDGKTLHLMAHHWDVVKAIGESSWNWISDRFFESPPPNSDNVDVENMGAMLTLVNSLGKTYKPTGEPTITVFWTTLIAGLYDGRPAQPDLFESFKEFLLKEILRRWALGSSQVRYRQAWLNSTLRNFEVFVDEWVDSAFEDANERLLPRLEDFIAVHDEPTYGLRELVSKKMEQWKGIAEMEYLERMKVIFTDLSNVVTMLSERTWPFSDAFESMYDWHRLFVTEKGYLGLGTESVKPGDVVMLVAGSYVPYVFRPTNEERVYKLVGEAYIHGIMNGEIEEQVGTQFEPTQLI